MPDIKTKSPRNTSTKVNSRINNHYSGPLKSVVGKLDSSATSSSGGNNRAGKFRQTASEEQTGTTGLSQTAENENHQPDNNNQHNGKSHLKKIYINNLFFI